MLNTEYGIRNEELLTVHLGSFSPSPLLLYSATPPLLFSSTPLLPLPLSASRYLRVGLIEYRFRRWEILPGAEA